MLVDRIDITPVFKHVCIDRDIHLSAHVSWVGSTSMETVVDVSQQDNSGQLRKLLGESTILSEV